MNEIRDKPTKKTSEVYWFLLPSTILAWLYNSVVWRRVSSHPKHLWSAGKEIGLCFRAASASFWRARSAPARDSFSLHYFLGLLFRRKSNKATTTYCYSCRLTHVRLLLRDVDGLICRRCRRRFWVYSLGSHTTLCFNRVGVYSLHLHQAVTRDKIKTK